MCSCDSCRYLTSPDHDSRSEVNQDGLVSDIGLDKNIIYIYSISVERGTSKYAPAWHQQISPRRDSLQT